MQMVFDFPIHPRYGFDNFVVCGGNEMAYRFALMLSHGADRNLLYIYGPPGSGKTHLLAALGKSLLAGGHKALDPAENPIPYISFRDIDLLYGGEYLAEQTSRLGERFRNAPALLIDDLHLIPDNIHLRVELWQIFNDFFNSGRKIAITGLYPPRELPTLDDHLISRLLWGLVARMDVSDDDSRRLIMKKLAEDRHVILSADVIDYLLLHTRRDIPALRETLDTVSRHALSTGRKISLRLAREVLDGKG
ncbi:MAG TPA: DnaA/Hda family protein [Geobacteraceae bacterium]|nr:DnaA/Hda family protein [Geobacteraceae bacterium]